MGQNFAASSASNCITSPNIFTLSVFTSLRSNVMYSWRFRSSGVLAFGVAFDACVAVWAITAGREATLRTRNSAIDIARIVVVLFFSSAEGESDFDGTRD